MSRKKRRFDLTSGEGLSSDPKRLKTPEPASVILGALTVDGFQKLVSFLAPILEPMIRRAVSETLELLLPEVGPARSVGRVSPKCTEVPGRRNLQLHFNTGLSLPIFTGEEVEGEQEAAIHVSLLDTNTGLVVTAGPESSAILDVVVIKGDFEYEDDGNWGKEEFESHIIKGREEKGPLLTGDLQVSLKEGVGTLRVLKFSDNSSWTRSKMFRLGLKVSSVLCEGVRIREAITKAIRVKDRRGKAYEKHYPPSMKDEVWRLQSIRRNGQFHKNLNENKVLTVEDFLHIYVRDPQRLRNILGTSITDKWWESLIDHAKTCPSYVSYAADSRNVGTEFYHIYESSYVPMQFKPADPLTESEKMSMVMQVGPQSIANYTASSTQEHVLLTTSLEPSPSETGDIASGDRGFVECTTDKWNGCTSHYNGLQDVDTPYVRRNQFYGTPDSGEADHNNFAEPELVPEEPPNFRVQSVGQLLEPTNLNFRSSVAMADSIYCPSPLHNHNDYLSLEDNDLIGNEVLGCARFDAFRSIQEDVYEFQPCEASYLSYFNCSPLFDFEEQQIHSSGKATIGWLKIKVAMKWGAFVRKIAADRTQAALVELEA